MEERYFFIPDEDGVDRRYTNQELRYAIENGAIEGFDKVDLPEVDLSRINLEGAKLLKDSLSEKNLAYAIEQGAIILDTP